MNLILPSLFDRLIFSQHSSRSTHPVGKKLQASLKSLQKAVQKLSKEIATKTVEELNANQNPCDYFSVHQKDGVDVDGVFQFVYGLAI